MAQSATENPAGSRISTFAVIDLETTDLPANCQNQVGITEMCIYAFDSAILRDSNASANLQLRRAPQPPRVLHKLNVLFQPSVAICPVAERITGLSNALLERETSLNENAGQLILNFIEHLPTPVCLIAHNGWNFDFPIIRKSFDELNLQFPATLRCVDSLRAFMQIDEQREERGLSWATTNRGSYNLGNLFKKNFGRPPIDAHQAEGDVKMLTQLVQLYGSDFFSFTEGQSIPFCEVVPLGEYIPKNRHSFNIHV